jgi:Flp pilus assembly protein TadG
MTSRHPASRAADLAVRGVRLPGGRTPRRGDRGAVLVHVAVAMMGLLAFSAVSIDLGTLWVARAQAQNAADAGALAGAAALAFVNPTDTDAATAAAAIVAQQNAVWGQPVTPASLDMASGACPAGSPAMSGACLQVRVSRNSASGTPLPVFFSRLFGVNAAEVTALASAKVMLGNTTRCLRPWAIADRWIEADGTWAPTDRYEAYVPGTSTPLSGPRDSYIPPGYDASLAGVEVWLERNDFDHPEIAGDKFSMLDLPATEADHELRYEQNIETCNPLEVSIGDRVPLTQAHLSSTETGVGQLVALDPSAYWDGTMVRGSAFNVSPRLVTVALYDPEALAANGTYNIGTEAVIRNLLGFFVIDFESNRLHGIFVLTSGEYRGDRPSVADTSSFLRSIALVR